MANYVPNTDVTIKQWNTAYSAGDKAGIRFIRNYLSEFADRDFGLRALVREDVTEVSRAAWMRKEDRRLEMSCARHGNGRYFKDARAGEQQAWRQAFETAVHISL